MPKLKERGLTDDEIRLAVASLTLTEQSDLLFSLIKDFKNRETVAVAVSLLIEKKTTGRIRRVDPLTVEMSFLA